MVQSLQDYVKLKEVITFIDSLITLIKSIEKKNVSISDSISISGMIFSEVSDGMCQVFFAFNIDTFLRPSILSLHVVMMNRIFGPHEKSISSLRQLPSSLFIFDWRTAHDETYSQNKFRAGFQVYTKRNIFAQSKRSLMFSNYVIRKKIF